MKHLAEAHEVTLKPTWQYRIEDAQAAAGTGGQPNPPVNDDETASVATMLSDNPPSPSDAAQGEFDQGTVVYA